MCGAAPGYASYITNLKNIEKKQVGKLLELVRKNRDTLFGREHRFDEIKDVDSFRDNVPVRDYEEFEPYIGRILEGEEGVLTREAIILLEPTGGTTGGSKLIPYTKTLKKEFRKAIDPWLFDIYKTNPKLLKGKSYWSITPVIPEKKYTKGGIPVGFEEDSDYLGFLGKILRYVLVAPKEVNRIRDIENFRYVTAYFLLSAGDLALISVWNPTFLFLILETMERNIKNLIRDIREGTLTLPTAENMDYLDPYLKRHPARADELARLIERDGAIHYNNIWKQLKLVSCWTCGFSQYYTHRLEGYFPGAKIQGKGLIATEGIVSIPFSNAGGFLPAYTSHFLEFIEDKEESTDEKKNGNGKGKTNGTAKMLHELETGMAYTVVITTGGGLYRYNLKDKITVTDRYKGLPLIRFEKRDSVSDMVGEKLSMGHVQRVVDEAIQKLRLFVDFIMLAPGIETSSCYYSIFLQDKHPIEPGELEIFREEIEKGLCENFHYKYARDLGQLGPLRIFSIAGDGMKSYFKRCTESGQRLGDIKPAVLENRTGWEYYFKGKFHTSCGVIVKPGRSCDVPGI